MEVYSNLLSSLCHQRRINLLLKLLTRQKLYLKCMANPCLPGFCILVTEWPKTCKINTSNALKHSKLGAMGKSAFTQKESL